MDEDITTIEDSFDMIPEEVKSYIYGDRFTKAFETLCVEKGFSQKERAVLEVSLFSYLAQLQTEESLLKTISDISPTPEINQSLITWITENVITPVFSIAVTAAANEEEQEENQPIVVDKAPIPSLSSIKDRLSQNSVVTPITRDYSIEKSQVPKNTPPPAIDPYRELPQ